MGKPKIAAAALLKRHRYTETRTASDLEDNEDDVEEERGPRRYDCWWNLGIDDGEYTPNRDGSSTASLSDKSHELF